MMKVSLLMDYEKIMIREDKQNYKVVQKHEETDEGLKNAVYLLKYIFENILEWTPYMIRDYFTPEISEWLHLENCVTKIPFPPELDHYKDYFFVAHYLYPKTLPYNKKKSVLEIYERERRKKSPKFPRNFFLNKEGKENFNICLKYVISENFYTLDSEDIYDFFSEPKRAKKFMSENYLTAPCNNHYTSIFEAIHSILPEGDKNETYYQYLILDDFLRKNKIKCHVIPKED